MKIVLPALMLPRSGGSRTVIATANLLAEAGHEVRIVTATGTAPFFLAPTVRFETTGPIDYAVSARSFHLALRRIRRRLVDADRIILTFFPLLLAVPRAMLASTVVWMQSDDAHLSRILRPPLLRSSIKEVIARLSYLLPVRRYAVSTWLATRLWKRYGLRCQVLYPVVDTDLFKPPPAVDPALAGCMGWLEPYKGTRGIVAAVAIARARRHSLRLRIIGCTPAGIADRNWMESRHPMDDRSLVDDLGGCGAFIQASRFEGFGLPPLEAMACGVPVAARGGTGADDYLTDGVNCLMFDNDQPNAIAGTLRRLLADPGLAGSLRSGGLHTAARFSLRARRNEIAGALGERW
ncbi:glycosyltransferase family 4 protein [bacterium]|nr:glycosyltransferase family 4 protein [candidate division CSSED10-310 bacterium]